MPVSPNMYTKNKIAQIIVATMNSLDDSIQDNGLINQTMMHARKPQITGTKITFKKFFIFSSFLRDFFNVKKYSISFGHIISKPVKMSTPSCRAIFLVLLLAHLCGSSNGRQIIKICVKIYLMSWNKGFTKETHPGVRRISETMKMNKLDNFKKWRDKMKKLGRIRSNYPKLKKNADLAELIGVTLGDGNIAVFPRTEAITISSNAKNKGFIKRYAHLIKKIFSQKPTINKPNRGCVRIRIYQKYISRRINIPTGSRKDKNIKIPEWILKNKQFLIRYLRGLYEAEGSFCIHKPTSTYKFLFSNKNKSLLNNVYRALNILGFHPHESEYKIQISKKEEVYKIKDLLKFRQY